MIESKQEFISEALQEGKQEGKLESVPQLLELGLNVEQLAEALDLDLEQVREAAQNQSKD